MNLFAHYLLYLNVGIIFVCAQNDGRYRPISSFITRKPVDINDGRYRPSNDGKYNPVNDGKYRPGNDGKYIHIGDKDRGQYTGGGGEYTGGGGEYTGGGGQYDGNNGGYNGGFGKYNGGSGQNIGGNNPNIVSKTNLKPNPVPANPNPLTSKQNPVPARLNPITAKPNPITAKPNPITTKPTPITAKPKAIPNIITGGKDGWKIIRDEKSEDTDGYHYLYETENGILAEESGRIENLEPNVDGLRSKGFYQYTGDDGVLYRVDYVADNNGFVPQGDHIPKTPPAIQKLLDYIASQS